jgi:hypothetical protein
MIVISIEPSFKIVKFMVPGSRILVLGWGLGGGGGSVEYVVKVHNFFRKSSLLLLGISCP